MEPEVIIVVSIPTRCDRGQMKLTYKGTDSTMTWAIQDGNLYIMDWVNKEKDEKKVRAVIHTWLFMEVR